MTLGRPPSHSSVTKVPHFSAVDDEFLDVSSEEIQQPQGTFSHVAFAVENVKLSEILSDALTRLYLHHAGDTIDGKPKGQENNYSPSLDAVIALESSLSGFEAALPSRLRWDHEDLGNDTTSRLFSRQRSVLHAR